MLLCCILVLCVILLQYNGEIKILISIIGPQPIFDILACGNIVNRPTHSKGNLFSDISWQLIELK